MVFICFVFFFYEGVVSGCSVSALPAPGFRDLNTGALSYVGNEGSVWSASADGIYSVRVRFLTNAVQPDYARYRGHGLQLRCLSE
ncbi:hypothetical protein [uncultured Rikenella sp.]|uniref:hypothetical protein n=1 Tax=uncultured Rikenella sp. TaxID=368003 RepID=UPI0025E6B6B7|nr:hypothetical protein [uncultured Rikenella sp.]